MPEPISILNRTLAELRSQTRAELTELVVMGTPEQLAAAERVLRARALEAFQVARGNLGAATEELIALERSLRRVVSAAAVSPVGDVLARINNQLTGWNDAIVRLIEEVTDLGPAFGRPEEAWSPKAEVPALPESHVAPGTETAAAAAGGAAAGAAPGAAVAGPPGAVVGGAIGGAAGAAVGAERSTLSASTRFRELRDEYMRSFEAARIREERTQTVDWYCDHLIDNKPRYERVGGALGGIPWYFIGIIHALEAGFSFEKHLHNGDPLPHPTVHVPAGRPPIDPCQWEESAADALTLKKLANQADWSLPAMLYRWEAYNGFGYRRRGISSPYLWSFSDRYDKGKYVRDGQFDANAVSKQCGAAVMLKKLKERDLVDI